MAASRYTRDRTRKLAPGLGSAGTGAKIEQRDEGRKERVSAPGPVTAVSPHWQTQRGHPGPSPAGPAPRPLQPLVLTCCLRAQDPSPDTQRSPAAGAQLAQVDDHRKLGSATPRRFVLAAPVRNGTGALLAMLAPSEGLQLPVGPEARWAGGPRRPRRGRSQPVLESGA